jgi:hypothetical protein
MRRSYLGRLCVAAAGLAVTSAATVTSADAASPAITTQASTGGTLGTAISDTATLTNFATPMSGTLTFTVFGPNDTTCSTVAATLTANPSPTANGTFPSPTFAPTAPGTYRFGVTYTPGSGDTNPTTNSPCTAAGESVTITPPPPAVPGGPPCTPSTPNVYGNGNEDGTYGNLGHGNQGNCNVGDGNEGDLNDGNGSASNPPEDE